jgi:hypothetical protein
VGTAGPTPVWPEDGPGRPDAGRPRVLVEVPGGIWPVTEAAEAAGLAVITCSGPRGWPSRCPVLSGRPCPLVAEADAVVVARTRDDDPCWPALLRGHAEIHPDVPVCNEPRGGRRLDVATVERAARPRAAARGSVRRRGSWPADPGEAPCA